ncbi:MAG: Fe-S cluster assembly ATPase SufC [Candidatus Woesearchaeota archaeon]
MEILTIEDLHAGIEKKTILQGLTVSIKKGSITVIMGPNGSGKSTLTNVLMGNPLYTVSKGKIYFNQELINDLSPDQRSKKGMFLSFQHPVALAGITVSNFLKASYEEHYGPISQAAFMQTLEEALAALGLPASFAKRYVNVGFSGGEKKRLEMVQLLLLKPMLAILDETDSGLDIDALRIVAQTINAFKTKERTIVLITHYARVLELIKPDKIMILMQGKIVHEGGPSLAKTLEKKGYAWLHEDNQEEKEV